MKMKNITTLFIKGMLLVSFMHAGTVAPSLSMRFNDLLNNNNALTAPDIALGLEANVGDGIYAGLESQLGLTDSRLYVKLGYGTFGMGTNAAGEPQFTIGGNYSVVDRFSVNLDYILNQLTDNGAGGSDPDELRITLKVDF